MFQPPLRFVAVFPTCRLLDTRTPAPGQPLPVDVARRLPILDLARQSQCAIPARSVAISVNVTALNATAAGTLRIFPAGQVLPEVANVSYSGGQPVGDSAIVALGEGGGVNVQASAGKPQLILDLSGVLVPDDGVPYGLIGWWPGDGNAKNLTNGVAGTLQGGMTFDDGRIGKAFQFDGVNDYVDLGPRPELDLPGSLTISAWVKMNGLPGNQDYLVADFNADATIYQGSLAVAAFPPWIVPFSEYLFWAQKHKEGDALEFHGATKLSVDAWYHVAVVRDDAAKTVKLYVDGYEDGSGSYAGKTVVTLQRTKQFGRSGPEFGDYLHGRLDEIQIYDRPLSPLEIATIFRAGRAAE